MITKDVRQICERMNAGGKSSTPFLFALNFEMSKGIFIENPLAQKEILFEIRGKGNKGVSNDTIKIFDIKPSPIYKGEYESLYSQVYEDMEEQLVSVVNLTVKTPIEISASLLDIFMSNTSLYQLYVPNHFVCFSPEQFIKIADGRIYTNPMKGTINASVPNAEQVILEDPKEIDEHCIVVDMVQEELRAVAYEVKVNRFRYIDRIKARDREILQVSSEIVGILGDDYLSHLGDIVYKMLPASSILGVPKVGASEVIRRVEKEPRGFYTGVCGYFDGKELNSGVLIRFIEQDENKFYFRSGGGITINSALDNEYQEVLNKIYLPR